MKPCSSCNNGEINHPPEARFYIPSKGTLKEIIELHGQYVCPDHAKMIASDYSEGVDFTFRNC